MDESRSFVLTACGFFSRSPKKSHATRSKVFQYHIRWAEMHFSESWYSFRYISRCVLLFLNLRFAFSSLELGQCVFEEGVPCI